MFLKGYQSNKRPANIKVDTNRRKILFSLQEDGHKIRLNKIFYNSKAF